MATLALSASRKELFLSQVGKAKEEIKTKFASARQLLDVREAELLSQLEALEVCYMQEGGGIAEQIAELNKLKEVQLATAKLNQNKDLVMQYVSQLDDRVRKLEEDLEKERASVRSVVVEWDTKVETKLCEFGKIMSKPVPDYKEIVNPEFVAFKHTSEQSETVGVFHCPRSIAVDAETGNIYICDCGNDRVQVFNRSFQFLFLFCEEMHRPDGICISDGRIYITQNWDNRLNVYNCQGKFFESVGKEKQKKFFSTVIRFDRPRGVAVSTCTSLIYVCDTGNDQIQCLNLDLTYNSKIVNVPKPRDIKITSKELAVLTEGQYCIYYYNFSHQLFRMIIPRGKDVKYPWHFCLDNEYNILLTDISSGCVAIFTNNGDLIHKLGKGGEERGEFKEPTGIAIDSYNRIIVASENRNNCLQIF